MLELQEIHSAESQLARLIPRLVRAVESEELRIAIEERLEEGEQVIADVEHGLAALGASAGRKKNVAAEGLVNDLRGHTQELATGPALDTVLIGGLQKTEHYCIAAWGTVKALAAAAGEDALVGAMERALEEGRDYDQRLTELAETQITPSMLSAEPEDEDEDEEDDDEEEEGEQVAGDDEDEDGAAEGTAATADDDEDEDEDEDDDDDDDDEDDDDDDDEDEDEDEDEDDDEEDDDTDDDDTPASETSRTGSRPNPRAKPPRKPQPPGIPFATIEEDAENKQEEEEVRGRGKVRPGRDN